MSCPVGGNVSSVAAQMGSPDETPAQLQHKPCYYSDYLKLDVLLDSQNMLSKSEENPDGAHDEMLFIIVHQTYELWFKQVLHELGGVLKLLGRNYVPESDLSRVVHHLKRVGEILKLAIQQFDVLETMTARDFMSFRDFLYPASGFQSVQFRLLENLLGVQKKDRTRYKQGEYHSNLEPHHAEQVKASESQETLFSCVERWLERTPFLETANYQFLGEYCDAVARMFDENQVVITAQFSEQESLERELKKNNQNRDSFLAMFDKERHDDAVARGFKRLSFEATKAALLITLYEDQPQLSVPRQILTALIDIDEMIARWRFRHSLMVHRMIGSNLGTGGSSGYHYLKSSIEPTRVFKDLGNLATFIIRPDLIPSLPADVKYQLSFVSEASSPLKKDKSK